MSPSAADVLGTSAVDPLAVVATPSAKRATAGFQEHLERANQAAQSPLFDGRESPARSARQDSTRHDSSHTEQADDPNRGPRDQAAPSTQAPKARRQEATDTESSGPTAEADRPATADEQSSADDAANSAAEQAAGQAGAADASAKPADQATKEETVAVVEADLTAELAAGTGPQTPAPETESAKAPVAVEAAVDAAAVIEEATASNPATAAASAQENALAEQVAETAAQQGQAEKAIATAKPTVEATAAAGKTTKPEVAAETDDEKSEAKRDESQESAVADAKPAGATTPVAAAVDAAAPQRDAGSKDEKPKSDDKPAEIGARSNETKPGGSDATRLDAAVRTPAAADAAVRNSAATGGEGTTNLSQVERTRLVQRVAKAVQTAHDRGGELKLRLSPPELGSIKLEVRLHEGVMSARIETETRDAQRVLNENLLVLRERLAEQNIKVERFDVEVFNPGAGGGGNTADFTEQKGDGRNESGARGGNGSRESAARGETRPSEVRRPAVSTDGRINVVV